MAGNRPHYLFRMLKTLRKVQGLNPTMVTVFIDGFYEEPASVARVFGLKVDRHEGISKRNSRICQVSKGRAEAEAEFSNLILYSIVFISMGMTMLNYSKII